VVECNMDRTVMRGPVHPAGVEEHITRKRIASELGRSHARPGQPALVRIGKGEPKPMMYERGKSDPAVVAALCRPRHSIAYADWRIMPNGLVFPEIHGELFVIGSA
jgi:hypothetical protein